MICEFKSGPFIKSVLIPVFQKQRITRKVAMRSQYFTLLSEYMLLYMLYFCLMKSYALLETNMWVSNFPSLNNLAIHHLNLASGEFCSRMSSSLDGECIGLFLLAKCLFCLASATASERYGQMFDKQKFRSYEKKSKKLLLKVMRIKSSWLTNNSAFYVGTLEAWAFNSLAQPQIAVKVLGTDRPVRPWSSLFTTENPSDWKFFPVWGDLYTCLAFQFVCSSTALLSFTTRSRPNIVKSRIMFNQKIDLLENRSRNIYLLFAKVHYGNLIYCIIWKFNSLNVEGEDFETHDLTEERDLELILILC